MARFTIRRHINMQAKKSIQQGAILLLTAGLCHVSEAQAPSLESTLQWIKMRLPMAQADWQEADGAVDTHSSYRDVVVSGCSLTFTNAVDRAGPERTGEYTLTVTLPLGQLSSARYVPNWQSHRFGAISLQSTNSVITGTWKNTTSYSKPTSGTQKAQVVEIQVSDSDLAQRLKSAFSRAIELCGGKKEAF
jgi:hypothetical protein